jgi:hypothetical protein
MTPRVLTVRVVPVAVAIAYLLVAPMCLAQEASADSEARLHFEKNLEAYLALRHAVSTAVPTLTVTGDSATLQRAENELAARLRRAREHARPGEIFTDDVARVLRNEIRQGLRVRGISPTELLATNRWDASRTPARDIRVNARFPWNSGWDVPPSILEVLPATPDVLEYRLVGHDLLLIDIGADLVVDVLRRAVE